MLYPGIDNRYASCGRARYDVKQDNNDPEFIARAMGWQKCPNSGRNGYKTFNVARTVIFPAVQFLKGKVIILLSNLCPLENRVLIVLHDARLEAI